MKALRNLATVHAPLQTLFRFGTAAAIYGGLAIFSCIAGVMLWLERPRAVEVAKTFLLVAAVLPIAFCLILNAAGMHFNLVQIGFNRLVYSTVWFAYLQISRRVKFTYREQAFARAEPSLPNCQ